MPRAGRATVRRGVILGTGEDMVRGESLLARTAALQTSPTSANWDELTKCQSQAAKGIYAQATSAYIQWLARDGRIETLRKAAQADREERRAKWLTKDGHKRVASMLAQLERAWNTWLDFAVENRALDSDEVAGFRESLSGALDALATSQAQNQMSENPAIRFIELIQSALSSGRAHLTAMNGGRPDQCEPWGWRAEGADDVYRALGERIGWVDGMDVYLQKDSAYAMAQKVAPAGVGVPVGDRTLFKRLQDCGFLRSWDTKRERNYIRKRIGGTDQSVLHLSARTLGVSLV